MLPLPTGSTFETSLAVNDNQNRNIVSIKSQWLIYRRIKWPKQETYSIQYDIGRCEAVRMEGNSTDMDAPIREHLAATVGFGIKYRSKDFEISFHESL